MTCRTARRHVTATLLALVAAALGMRPVTAQSDAARTFATPKAAVDALIAAAKSKNLDDLLSLFGPDGRDLIASSDAATARANRDVFVAAVAQGWRLSTVTADRRELVIGDEDWPFPIPLVKSGTRWKFDTARGKQEVLDRRIGSNELSAIDLCRTYVAAQKRYARQGHDGKPAGVYAAKFQSDAGKQNGLYWKAAKGQPFSPLGDLVAQAALDARAPGAEPSPLHGYYFKILTAQGAAAAGGAKSYLVNGDLTQGFALVAWPAHHDQSGIMTFVVNQDGVLRQKNLGAETDKLAPAMTAYNPDATWTIVK